MPRYEHAGAAKPTTLANTVVSGDTTIVGTDLTGWPTGATGPFWFCFDAGNAGEEKCLATTRTGNTLNSVTRGQDSSTATGHSAGVTLTHIFSALEADQANSHINATAAVHGISGSVVGTTDSQTLTNKTLTSPVVTTPTLNGSGGALTLPTGPDTLVGRATTDTLTNKTLNGATLDAASTLGGISGTTIAADHAGGASFTPSVTNLTLGNGTAVGKSLKVGKRLIVEATITFGSTTTVNGALSVALPAAGQTPNDGIERFLGLRLYLPSSHYMGFAVISANGTSAALYSSSSPSATNLVPVDQTHPVSLGWPTGSIISLWGSVEVQ